MRQRQPANLNPESDGKKIWTCSFHLLTSHPTSYQTNYPECSIPTQGVNSANYREMEDQQHNDDQLVFVNAVTCKLPSPPPLVFARSAASIFLKVSSHNLSASSLWSIVLCHKRLFVRCAAATRGPGCQRQQRRSGGGSLCLATGAWSKGKGRRSDTGPPLEESPLSTALYIRKSGSVSHRGLLSSSRRGRTVHGN